MRGVEREAGVRLLPALKRWLPPPQEPALFGTTILENIRFGKPSASDAEVYAAARLANADSFVHSFPQGYGTIVGERRALAPSCAPTHPSGRHPWGVAAWGEQLLAGAARPAPSGRTAAAGSP